MKNTELLLRSIIETANDAIITSDSDGNITAWNRAAVDIFGYSHDEIMGKPVITIMPQRSHVAHRKGMRRVTTTGESHILGSAVEILGLRKDGTEIPIELSLAKWTTKDGQFFTAIIRDINRRKRTEEALKESEEKFSRAFHSNPHPMSIVTLAEGHYLDVNDSYVQAFGFSREELLGRTTVEMGILKDDSARKKILHSLKEGQAVKNLELELYTRSGRKADALLSADKTEIGGQICLLSILTDITERKQAEEALRESEERYRAMVELGAQTGEAVVMLQDDERGIGMHVFASEEWPIITGYSIEELLNMSMADLIHPRDREAAMERYNRRMRGEELPGLYESNIIRKDGTEVPVEVTYAFSRYHGKRVNVGFIRDITERKQAEEKRIQLIQELQETLKEVRTLSGLLPICAWCKKLRDDEGYWKSVEQYIGERTKAEFTHGVCPECQSKFFREKNSDTKVN